MAEELTIDELARRTGLTTRNIRAYQTRGLLRAPRMRGRTGVYGPDHMSRIQIIRDMQAAGFNLEAIRRLLELIPPGAGEDVLGFERALLAPWVTEEAEVVDAADLVRLFPGAEPEAALERAERLGVIIPLGDGRYRVPSPALLRAGMDVVALGVPLEEALGVLEQVMRHSRGIADAFVRLFLRNVWQPFDRAGRPGDEFHRVRESIERLRPLATSVLLAAFGRSMAAEVESAFGEELARASAQRTPA